MANETIDYAIKDEILKADAKVLSQISEMLELRIGLKVTAMSLNMIADDILRLCVNSDSGDT